jgi:hypothetical protein
MVSRVSNLRSRRVSTFLARKVENAHPLKGTSLNVQESVLASEKTCLVRHKPLRHEECNHTGSGLHHPTTSPTAGVRGVAPDNSVTTIFVIFLAGMKLFWLAWSSPVGMIVRPANARSLCLRHPSPKPPLPFTPSGPFQEILRQVFPFEDKAVFRYL